MTSRKKLTFWGADEHDNSLVREVSAGRKTVTANTVEDYCKGYGELGDGNYAAGDILDVHDLQGRPRCTIRAIEVRIVRFGDISGGRVAARPFRVHRNFATCKCAACRT